MQDGSLSSLKRSKIDSDWPVCDEVLIAEIIHAEAASQRTQFAKVESTETERVASLQFRPQNSEVRLLAPAPAENGQNCIFMRSCVFCGDQRVTELNANTESSPTTPLTAGGLSTRREIKYVARRLLIGR